jgi:hypothetical protein
MPAIERRLVSQELGPRGVLPSRRRARPTGSACWYRLRNSWASTIAEMAREACGCVVESRVSRSYSMDGWVSSSSSSSSSPSGGAAAGERPSTRAVWILGRSRSYNPLVSAGPPRSAPASRHARRPCALTRSLPTVPRRPGTGRSRRKARRAARLRSRSSPHPVRRTFERGLGF